MELFVDVDVGEGVAVGAAVDLGLGLVVGPDADEYADLVAYVIVVVAF